MTIPDAMIIDGHAVSWTRLREKRREMVEAARALAGSQPALFELRTDCKPPAARSAEGRFLNPSLFDWCPKG